MSDYNTVKKNRKPTGIYVVLGALFFVIALLQSSPETTADFLLFTGIFIVVMALGSVVAIPLLSVFFKD